MGGLSFCQFANGSDTSRTFAQTERKSLFCLLGLTSTHTGSNQNRHDNDPDKGQDEEKVLHTSKPQKPCGSRPSQRFPCWLCLMDDETLTLLSFGSK